MMNDQIVEEGELLTPIPRQQGKALTMSFPDAIGEVVKGKSITRMEWGNTDYCLLKDGWLTIYINDKFQKWLISDGDMDANDWYVVKELN